MKDRRIRKSQKALRDAFIALVLERGYDDVTVEDIADRADVARATFYAHYADKEQMLAILFEELTAELTAPFTEVEGSPPAMRTYILRELYAHAAQYRDIYLVCLRGAGNGRARAAYLDIIAARAQTIFEERFRVSQLDPEVPLSFLGRAFAGAHVALLEEWLEHGELSDLDSVVRMEMELLTRGFAWALGMLPKDFAQVFPDV